MSLSRRTFLNSVAATIAGVAVAKAVAYGSSVSTAAKALEELPRRTRKMRPAIMPPKPTPMDELEDQLCDSFQAMQDLLLAVPPMKPIPNDEWRQQIEKMLRCRRPDPAIWELRNGKVVLRAGRSVPKSTSLAAPTLAADGTVTHNGTEYTLMGPRYAHGHMHAGKSTPNHLIRGTTSSGKSSCAINEPWAVNRNGDVFVNGMDILKTTAEPANKGYVRPQMEVFQEFQPEKFSISGISTNVPWKVMDEYHVFDHEVAMLLRAQDTAWNMPKYVGTPKTGGTT